MEVVVIDPRRRRNLGVFRYVTVRELTADDIGMTCQLFEGGRRDGDVVRDGRVMISATHGSVPLNPNARLYLLPNVHHDWDR